MRDALPSHTPIIIPFPDFQKLKEEIEKLRTELSMLVLERDELRFVICKNIEMEYMLKIGGLEYQAYEAECTFLRLKRKVELIQAKKNRQEKVILSVIEDALDHEFLEYQKRLDEQMDKMNDALERNKAEPLSEEESRELKILYRKVVKALHPDMNPEITDAQARLFDQAVSAYKNGDLPAMRLIDEMVGGGPVLTDQENMAVKLSKEKDRLNSLLERVRKEIEKIKTQYPYTMKEFLEDSEKLERRREELEKILEQYQELAAFYRTKIEEMLR